MIRPFKINISDKIIQNIYTKVEKYSWHEMPDDGGWAYGTNLDYLKEFSNYWVNEFDWRKTEEKINKFQNFKSNIDGIDIHFIHEKGSGSGSKPLLLSHGWPGSIIEFLHIIDQLAHPEKFGGKEKPELGHEMISVVFFQDKGLKRSQQMFSDLNKNAVKPTKSLSILYDHRDKFSKFIVGMVNIVEIFQGRVELEKTTMSNRSTKVFTLNGISDATMHLFGISKGKKLSKEEEDITKKFWDEISKNIPEWQLLLEKKITPIELRKEFVHSTTNSLNALGIVGRIILQKHPENWKEKLRGLKDINWSRNNSEWEGRLLLNGRMLKTTLGVELAANTILKKCGIPLSEDRLKHENRS